MKQSVVRIADGGESVLEGRKPASRGSGSKNSDEEEVYEHRKG